MNTELLEALNILEKEKDISKETLLDAIENSLMNACKNHFGKTDNIKLIMNKETCEYQLYAEKTVVEEVEDKLEQISLEDAKEIDIVLEQDGVLNPIEIKKTSNPGTELTKVFSLLDKASVPRGKGAIVCMKPKVGIIDRDNYIVPIWII